MDTKPEYLSLDVALECEREGVPLPGSKHGVNPLRTALIDDAMALCGDPFYAAIRTTLDAILPPPFEVGQLVTFDHNIEYVLANKRLRIDAIRGDQLYLRDSIDGSGTSVSIACCQSLRALGKLSWAVE